MIAATDLARSGPLVGFGYGIGSESRNGGAGVVGGDEDISWPTLRPRRGDQLPATAVYRQQPEPDGVPTRLVLACLVCRCTVSRSRDSRPGRTDSTSAQ